LFHFLKNDSRNFLRRVGMTVNIYFRYVVFSSHYFERYSRYFIGYFIITAPHKTLNGIYCSGRINDGLTFCRISNFSFTIFQKSYYRWSSSFSFIIWYNNRLISLHHCNTRVGSTQVDSNNFSHDFIVY